MQTIYPSNQLSDSSRNYLSFDMQASEQNANIPVDIAVDSDKEGEANKKRMKRNQNIAKLTFSCGVVFMVVLLVLVANENIVLSGRYTEDDLQTFWQKLEFTLRYQALGLSVVGIIVQVIALQRLFSAAIDPTSNNEKVVLRFKNVLTNSMEQFLMSMSAQMILTTNLNAGQVMVYIPFMAITFFVGRLVYVVTYPRYRGFGFAVTFLPTFVAIIYCLIKVSI